jgi:Tfp pilus assembly PilM family ATPase
MKRLACTFFVLFASSTLGCGMLVPQAPQGGGGGAGGAPGYTVPKESQDAIRKQEMQSYAAADDAADEQLDKQEKETLSAIRVSLGKEKWTENMQPPLPASQGVVALRKMGVKIRLEPTTNAATGRQNDDFLTLNDGLTDKITAISRKQMEGGRLTASEQRTMRLFQKSSFKVMDLRMQVSRISVAAVSVNSGVQSSSLSEMLRVSNMVRMRKLYSMELTPEDYALVKRGLERQKRAEAIAATTMAMLAAYQAVINDHGDPKALDVIAKGALEAFPIKPSVTDEDAKQYVAALGDNVSKVKARYEAQMRKAWGDAKYEKSFKSGIDAMFAQAEGAQNQKSIGEIGCAYPQQDVRQIEVSGRHLAEGVPKMITIDSNDVLEALREPLSGIVAAVKQALEQTPPELCADDAERGILLTGGGALLRDLDRLLSDETGLHVQVADDPLTCVARGGGRALELVDMHGNEFFAPE